MNFTGFTVRYFTAIHNGSFLFDSLKTNAVEYISGGSASGKEFRIGFTGITGDTSWYFRFMNGKIYDPQGKWFGSYNDESITNLSGNFESGFYNYYLNGELINAKGTMGTGDFNGFFVQCFSGASGQARVYVDSSPITTYLSMKSGFYIGGNWSGSFYHNHDRPIVIRSGEIFGPDISEFIITGTGLCFCSGNNVLGPSSYRTVTIAHTGISYVTGMYYLGVRVYTDFGPATFTISGSGVPVINGNILNGLSPSELTISAPISQYGSGSFYFSTLHYDLQNQPQSRPYHIKVEITSGYTGAFKYIEDWIISDSGANYVEPTYLFIDIPDDGYPSASGHALLDGGGGITGIIWDITGYYTGVLGAEVLITSGTAGAGFVGSTMDGAWVDTCHKGLGGGIQIYTGAFGSGLTYADPVSLGMWTGSGTLMPWEEMVELNLSHWMQGDNLGVGYRVTFSGLTDTASGVNMFTGSGIIIQA